MEQFETSTFVGRSAELSSLVALLEGVERGCGFAILICGDSGIGKTRLVREITQRTGEEIAWASRTCTRGSVAPFAALFELLEGIGVDLDPLHEILSCAPSDASAKLRLWRAIVGAFEKESQSRPLALFVDNIQWADPESLELLNLFCEKLEQTRIALLMTYTPAGVSTLTSAETLVRQVTHGVIKKLNLEKLQPADACALVSTILLRSNAGLSQERVANILLQADGNPLLLIELFRDAIELHNAGVPDCAISMAQFRLRQFDQITQRIVLVASAFGDSVASEQLAKVLECSNEEMEARLQQVCISKLMTEDGEGIYTFGHTLLREAVYKQFTAAFAKITHESIARTLEREEHNEVHTLATIALHYGQAGALDKAIRYDLAAGDSAMKSFAYGAAVISYERAFRNAISNGSTEVAKIASKLGDALMVCDRPSKAIAYYRTAMDRNAGDLTQFAYDATRLAKAYHESGNEAQALDVIEILRKSFKASSLPEDVCILAALCEFNITQSIEGPWLSAAINSLGRFDASVRSKLKMLMASSHFRKGNVEIGENLFDEACNEAADGRNEHLMAQVLLAKTHQLATIGRFGDALSASARAYGLAASKKGDAWGPLTRMTEIFSYCAYGYELARTGKFREARVALDRIGDLTFEPDIGRLVAYASMMRLVAVSGGPMPYQVGSGLESRLFALARETRHSETIAAVAEALALWHRARGSMETARRVLHIALEEAGCEEAFDLLLLIGEFGEWGDVPKARRLLERGLVRCVPEKKAAYSDLFEAFVYQRQGKRASAQRRGRRASGALEKLGEKVRFAQALEISGQRREARMLAIAMGMEPVSSDGRKVRRERISLLTTRQEQLRRLVVRGFSNAEIARELGISEGTVRVHLTEVFRRAGVRSRSQLIASHIANANL